MKKYSMNSKNQNRQNEVNKHKQFLNDFCLLAELTSEEQGQFQKANVDNIEEQYQARLLKNQAGQRYRINCPIEDFQHYGPGIYLLFKFLKLCIVLFMIASIFAIANMILLSQGTIYQSNIKSTQFKIKLGVITFGNIKKQYEQLVPVLSFVGFLLFTGGIIYWKERQIYQVIKCSKVRLLSSYYTVILTDIPDGYTEFELKQFLKEFGEVKQIFSVKSFDDDLSHYKQMNQILNSYKQKKNILKLNSQTENSLKLCRYFIEFFNYYKKQINEDNVKYEPIFAFVTFTDIISRQILLQTMQNSQRVFCFKSDQYKQISLYKGQRLKFKECEIEPDAINWQNISLSMKNKALRLLLQIGLLSIILIISIIIIYFFAVTQITLINSKYSSLTKQQIMNLNQPQAVKYYCTSLSLSKFYSQSVCQSYRGLFLKTLMLELFLPIIISFLKFIFVKIMNSAVQFRKYATYIKQIQSQIIIIYLFYFIVLGILQFVINIQIKTDTRIYSIQSLIKYCFPFYEYILPSSTSFANSQDYNMAWYYFNSSQITLISLLAFNLQQVLNILYSLIRRCICQYYARKQLLNIQKSKYLKGQILQIEYIYASALIIISFTLLFAPVIPIVWIFGVFSFLVLFWSSKYIFIQFCEAPFVFGHSINHLVIRITFITISICCLAAPLLYGGLQGLTFSQRYIKYLYFPILTVLILLYMFCKKFIIILIIKLKNIISNNILIRKNRLPSVICNIEQVNYKLPLYSMHQNKTYEPILKLLYIIKQEERKRNTFIFNQNLNSFIETVSKSNNQFNQFRELIQLIRQDRKKYEKHKNNPFTHSNKEIQFIFKLNRQFKTILYNTTKLPLNSLKSSQANQILGRDKSSNKNQNDSIKQSQAQSHVNQDNYCKESQRQLNYISPEAHQVDIEQNQISK